MIPTSLLAGLALLPLPLLQEPPGEVLSFLLSDGSRLTGRVWSWDEKEVVLGLAAGKRKVDLPSLLLFQREGVPRAGREDPAIHLQNGSLLRAGILGGDEDGEVLFLQSPLLGFRRLSLDLVRLIRFPKEGRLPDPRQLLPGKGEEESEILFRRALLGVDPVKGFLFRIGEKGIHFAPWHAEDRPDLHPWKEVRALRLPSEAGKASRGLVVLTRRGSLFRGRPEGVEKGRLLLATQAFGRVALPLSSILAGHVEDPGNRTWLSDLAPLEVEERGPFGKEAHWPRLWGHRKDRNVYGSFAIVRGRCWTRALGVHSFSRLRFRVPEGRTRFLSSAGVDDAALRAEIAGNVDLRLLLDGEPVQERASLKGGEEVWRLKTLRVKPGQILGLEVGLGSDAPLFTGDCLDWLAPVFLP